MKLGRIIIPGALVALAVGGAYKCIEDERDKRARERDGVMDAEELMEVARFVEKIDKAGNEKIPRNELEWLQACANADVEVGREMMEKELGYACEHYCETLRNEPETDIGVVRQAQLRLPEIGMNDKVVSCKYEVLKSRIDLCNATVRFTIKALDDRGEEYTITRDLFFRYSPEHRRLPPGDQTELNFRLDMVPGWIIVGALSSVKTRLGKRGDFLSMWDRTRRLPKPAASTMKARAVSPKRMSRNRMIA